MWWTLRHSGHKKHKQKCVREGEREPQYCRGHQALPSPLQIASASANGLHLWSSSYCESVQSIALISCFVAVYKGQRLATLSRSLIYSLTCSLTHSLSHSPMHSLTCALSYALTHSLMYSSSRLTHFLLICSFTYSLTHSLTHPSTHSFLHSFSISLFQSLTHSVNPV